MKKTHPLFIVLTGLLLLQCNPGRKITYNIPADYPEEVRKEAIVIFEKGKELYKANCSQCHGIFTKGKKNIPDFSTVQLDNYSARFLRGDPENHAIARKMSAEQLNQVVVFLRYKKMKKPDTTAAAGKR